MKQIDTDKVLLARDGVPPEPLASLRKRWRGLIGPMKQKLRAELAEGQA